MNTLYKNTEAQITQKLRTIKEQWPGWMQKFKKTSRVRNGSNQLKLDTQMSNEWTECCDKIRSMPSKSSAAVNKMWYSRIWELKYKIFPSNQQHSYRPLTFLPTRGTSNVRTK